MRSLSKIAAEIKTDWTNISTYAKPYLNAMHMLDSINDKYMLDPADEIVRRFLANARSWQGNKAREIKAELKKMLK